VESRLGLLGTDLEIEGLRLAKLLFGVAMSLFLAFLGVVLLVATIAILFVATKLFKLDTALFGKH
jgi:uncharacterized membrane protein YqjE